MQTLENLAACFMLGFIIINIIGVINLEINAKNGR